ncbi:FecR family protein [Chitinophaga sp. XS-30]|uniref:FecR family protein n=1 Tax=Chitinophaga sp. XS-30 TaxID=2604421 RepID=UPI00143D5F93|nr:FecR family protein [Chitinophaga sp. XS-30]
MSETRFSALLELYVTGRLSAADKAEFFQMLHSGHYDEQLEQIMEEDWRTGRYEEEENQLLRSLIAEKVNFRIDSELADKKAVRPRISWLQSPWLRYAAVLALLLSIGAYFWLQQRPAGNTAVADVAPGGTKAILTLQDGSAIPLDSTGRQSIRQGRSTVLQQGGQLQYDVQGKADVILHNTLTTPRGGQFRIILPDGSKVWLNAASSIRYPTAFAGKERLVEVSGEVYFEIAPDAQMPFVVKMQQGNRVEVLGTHFNLNAYTDEPAIQTTLLEGAVRVSNATGNAVLSPGQQALVSPDNSIRVVPHRNAAQVVAWKDGLFNFEGATLEDVMRQLARWYDIDIVYEKGIPPIGFGGKIERDLTLTGVLKVLQTAGVHFRLEGKRLVVMP